MANTYTFTSVTNGQAKFKKNSEFWHIIEEEDKLDQTGATAMRMHNHNGQYDINLAADTVIINGTTYAPGSDFDTVYDALNPLFHKANTGTGGTGEGGGGLTLEIYQNSAMSAPVQAYVFRDADDNIVRVYEPVRNNDVSRYSFAYADSIDKFPFDSLDCFNNVWSDVKCSGIESDIKIQGCDFRQMVIKGNNHTGLILQQNIYKGNYGALAPNLAELYFDGDASTFEQNTILGAGSSNDADAPTSFNIGGGSMVIAFFCGSNNEITVGSGLYLESIQMSSLNTITFETGVKSIVMGNQNTLTFAGNNHSNITFGNVNQITLAGGCQRCSFGNRNTSILLNSQNICCSFGNDNTNITLNIGDDYMTFGNGNYDITFLGGSDGMVFGNVNSGMSFSGNCRAVSIGSFNTFSGHSFIQLRFSTIHNGCTITADVDDAYDLVGIEVGDNVTVNMTESKSNTRYINSGGVVYELGVSEGALLATPV